MSASADIVSYIGTALVVILIGAQLPAMYTVVFKTRSVENLSILPTVGQTSNFVSWVVYGLRKGDPNIIRVNAIGCGFMLLYIAVFGAYSAGATRRGLLATLFGTLAALAGVFVGVLLPPGLTESTRETILGCVAVGCNTVMYAAPLSQLWLALKQWDPTMIPFALTFAGLGCSAMWLLYGLMVNNWFVAGPNAAGVFLSIVQLGVIAYLYVRVRLDPSLRKLDDEEDAEALISSPEASDFLHEGSLNASNSAAVRKSTKPRDQTV